MNAKGMRIYRESSYLLTTGLSQLIGYEFKLRMQRFSVIEYTDVLNYLIDYCISSRPDIKPDQTIAYHSWLLKCTLTSDSYYNLWEANLDGEGFIEGADHSIKVTQDQGEVCKTFNTLPTFPTFNQKVVISKGVLQGLRIEAVRYPSPNHMTGWWLTTELYDGNVKSLMQVHYFHVAFKRNDLIKYLALPSGYRFSSGTQEDIWFDQKILLEEN